jgi:hypothetical protein
MSSGQVSNIGCMDWCCLLVKQRVNKAWNPMIESVGTMLEPSVNALLGWSTVPLASRIDALAP